MQPREAMMASYRLRLGGLDVPGASTVCVEENKRLRLHLFPHMTKAEYDVMLFARRAQENGWDGMLTGRSVRRSAAESCVGRGWLKRVEVDGDGDTIGPERTRTGFAITEDGMVALLGEEEDREARADAEVEET